MGSRSLTPMEEKLAAYWREVLKIETIEAADHFIELGGHSMLAMTLLNRLEEEFGVRLRMQDVFQPLHRLAETCEALLAEQGDAIAAASELGGHI